MPRRHPRTRYSLIALGGYSAAVTVVAFWPTPVDRPVASWIRRALGRLHEYGLPEWIDYSIVEFSANVVLFAPLGFLLAAIAGRKYAWLGALAGLAMSATIECTQWTLLPERFPAVSDVAANSIGTLFGTLVFILAIGNRQSSHS